PGADGSPLLGFPLAGYTDRVECPIRKGVGRHAGAAYYVRPRGHAGQACGGRHPYYSRTDPAQVGCRRKHRATAGRTPTADAGGCVGGAALRRRFDGIAGGSPAGEAVGMNLMADEGLERAVVERLRADGHSVRWVAELAPSVPDEEVLRLA